MSGAGGNRTLVQRCDCWRFLHVYFCLLSGGGGYRNNPTPSLSGVLMAHLAGVSGHIRVRRLLRFVSYTDKSDGNNSQC